MSADEIIEFAARPKPSDLGQELGVNNTLPSGSWLDWISSSAATPQTVAPNNSPLSIDQLVEMRRKDGQVRALIGLITLPIIHALQTAKWVAPEGVKSEAPEVKFANDMFTVPPAAGGMTVTFQKFMRHVLLAVLQGSAAFEEVRHIPKTGPLKGKIVLKKMAYRDARTVRFLVDDTGGFNGIRQVAAAQGRTVDVVIPADKVWYYASHEEENPFYGVSWFEAAYSHYEMKRRLYYVSHIAAQFSAVPGRIGKIPRQATVAESRAFRKGLESFAFNTAMAMPEGFDVQFASQASGFNFLSLIDHQNQQIAKSVLAKFMEDSGTSTLIENGTSDASNDFFLMAIESLMDEIAANLTHYLMPKYIDWNFGSGVYPVFKFGQLADSTRDTIKELFQTIAMAQSSQWTPEFIRELEKKLSTRFGFDIDYKMVEERDKKDRAMMDAQMQAQMGGAPGGAPEGEAPAEEPASPDAAAPDDLSQGLMDEFQMSADARAADTSGVTISLADIAAEVARLSREEQDAGDDD